ISAMIREEIKALSALLGDDPFDLDPVDLPQTPTSCILDLEAVRSSQPESSQPATSINVRQSDDLPLMSEAIRKCIKHNVKEKAWSPKTEFTRNSQLKLFVEVCGDKPVNSYTRGNFREFKELIQTLPPNSHKKKEFKGLSKREI